MVTDQLDGSTLVRRLCKVIRPGFAATVSAVASFSAQPFARPVSKPPEHEPQEVLIKLKRPLDASEQALLAYNLDADRIDSITDSLQRVHSRSRAAAALVEMLRFHDASSTSSRTTASASR